MPQYIMEQLGEVCEYGNHEKGNEEPDDKGESEDIGPFGYGDPCPGMWSAAPLLPRISVPNTSSE